jgi:penicillin amidase
MNRALRALLVMLLVFALMLTALFAWSRSSLPATSGTRTLPGLARAVEIERDASGIPRIVAESQEDTYFALGFVHAQDRLWQMEHDRLVASGRLAEVLGERAVASDRLVRILGLRAAAERDLEELDPRSGGALQAYVDGVNAYIATAGVLPPEFLLLGWKPEEWRTADVMALWKLFLWRRAGDWRHELARARVVAEVPAERARGLMPDSFRSQRNRLAELTDLYRSLPLAALAGTATNDAYHDGGDRAWVLAAPRTLEGAPLMGHEDEGLLVAPARHYLVRLRAPGVDATGATLPGLPVLLSGRNASVAWALVDTPVDTQDLFVERLRAPSGGADTVSGADYLSPGGWRPLAVRREELTVRGADNVELTLRSTDRGPLVSDLVGGVQERGADDEELVLALSWPPLLEADGSFRAALGLPQVTSWSQFGRTLEGLDGWAAAGLYADAGGTIGMQATGLIPRRAGEGTLPLPGWERAAAWNGFTPFGRLERIVNPDSGIIAVVTSPLAGANSERPEEDLVELLRSLERHGVESFESLFEASMDPLAAEMLPLLRAARPVSAAARAAHAELLGWDGRRRRGSAAPLIFRSWYDEFAALLLGGDQGDGPPGSLALLPELVLRAAGEDSWCDAGSGRGEEGCVGLASEALERSALALTERHGADPADWPRFDPSAVSYRHETLGGTLLAPLFNAGSGDASPASDRFDQERGSTEVGPVYRAVFDLAQESGGGFLIPTGQTGNPLSAEYREFVEGWRGVRLIPFMAGEEEGSPRSLVLEPRR